MRAITFCFLGLLAAGLGARAGENLSPEALLPGHEATCARQPSAAFGKDVFLLVWRAGENEKADIVGMRFDKSGKPLDAKPFVISGAKDCQDQPRVAFGGGCFLVVWQDLRSVKTWDVCAARVTPEGKVLDPDGLAVAVGDASQCEPAVGFDGAAFQVLWRQREGAYDIVQIRGGYDIHGGRVAPDGRLLDGAGVLVVKSPRVLGTFSMGAPGVLSASGGTLLAGARHRANLQLWRMRDGKMDGKLVTVMPGEQFNGEPAFATDGKNVLAVWTTLWGCGGRAGGWANSGVMLLKPDGPPEGTPKNLCSTFKLVSHPCPAWDGAGYVVAWDLYCVAEQYKPKFDRVLLRRVSAAGEPQGEDQLVAGEMSSPAFWPAVASDGAGTTLIAYERHPKTADTPIKIAFRMLKAQ